MSDDSTPSHPMLQVFKDIGSIKTGIANLEGGQAELDGKVSGLHHTIAGLVTSDECEAHRDALEASMEMAEGPTAQLPPGGPGLLERAGKHAKAITAILVLLGMVGGILLVMSRLVGSVERTLAADRQAQKAVQAQVLQELKKPQEPVVVREKVYVYPDAGARRRRRRPVRRRRVPRTKRTP